MFDLASGHVNKGFIPASCYTMFTVFGVKLNCVSSVFDELNLNMQLFLSMQNGFLVNPASNQ